jgi:hypothetical protein
MPAMEVVAPEKPPYKNVSDEHIFSVGAGYDLAFGTLTKQKTAYICAPLASIFPRWEGFTFLVLIHRMENSLYFPPSFLAYFPSWGGIRCGC